MLAALVAIAVPLGASWADTRPPAFAGKAARPRIVTAQDREFRTLLRNTSLAKPDFAGHYVMVVFGCGTSCVMAAAIDARTGIASWLPFTVCCWSWTVASGTEPIEYRRNSALVVVNGKRNEDEADAEQHFYRFTGGRFIPLP